MRRNYFLITLLAVFLVALVVKGSELGHMARRALLAPSARNAPDAQTLMQENLALKAELIKIEKEEAMQGIHFTGVRANVYSRYPFNLKDILTLSAGTRDGVTVGAAIVMPAHATGTAGIFIGLISKTSDFTSEAQTVFDPSLKLPVRIGRSGAQALLTGGLTPMLTLIGKDAKIQEGDIVYSAVSGVPYGLAVGYAGTAVVSEDQIFKEAPLELPFSFGDIEVVEILIQQ
ncbi:MAG: rod shape-determining protein MreC [bacterium]|nr:rod shape-determining protein MreC [bacterium]